MVGATECIDGELRLSYATSVDDGTVLIDGLPADRLGSFAWPRDDHEPAASVVLTVLADGTTTERTVRLDMVEVDDCTFIGVAQPALTRTAEDMEVAAIEQAEVRGVVITAEASSATGMPSSRLPYVAASMLFALMGVTAMIRSRARRERSGRR